LGWRPSTCTRFTGTAWIGSKVNIASARDDATEWADHLLPRRLGADHLETPTPDETGVAEAGSGAGLDCG
jgi:hypothetical protein